MDNELLMGKGAGARPSVTMGGKGGDPDSIYDTLVVSNTVLNGQLFQIPANGAAGKTEDLTNMKLAGQLPNGQSLYTAEVNFFVLCPTILASAKVVELYKTLSNTTFSFEKNNKGKAWTKTAQMLLGPASLVSVVPTTSGDNIPLIQPFYRGKWRIRTRSLDLGQGERFTVYWQHGAAPDSALNGLQMKLEFAGIINKKITA